MGQTSNRSERAYPASTLCTAKAPAGLAVAAALLVASCSPRQPESLPSELGESPRQSLPARFQQSEEVSDPVRRERTRNTREDNGEASLAGSPSQTEVPTDDERAAARAAMAFAASAREDATLIAQQDNVQAAYEKTLAAWQRLRNFPDNAECRQASDALLADLRRYGEELDRRNAHAWPAEASVKPLRFE